MLGPYKDVHSITFTASADVKDSQAVGYDDAPAGANAKVKCIAHYDRVAGKDAAGMQIGELPMRAGAPINAGDDLITDADGNPIPVGATPDPNVFAKAQATVANPGELVLVLLKI